ncbi:ABC transporter permease subunit [Paenibacillus pasadenensis]|uniref:ABC transporter permease n=1 Tax=Paenibacillus pasadenensis TaxID=217090 RepID=UPI00203F619A|nr:ABC transporter permease subunit [Paenibacillus pasadenensis]MCM3746868.1 ABC transporter permease subunit [Paenibacillus pasadenensis]
MTAAKTVRLFKKSFRKRWQLYLFMIIPLLHITAFKYVPMFGNVIAFQDYSFERGLFGSDWIGFKYFKQFFDSPEALNTIRNTILISLFTLICSFPVPILLAIMLNEIRSQGFKKIVQMVTYAPYFISTVVVVSMLMFLLSPHTGFVNPLLVKLGMEPINFMGESQFFRPIYILSDIWQTAGYSAIIYIAALAGVNPESYEAARMDGATRLQKIRHIDLPWIMPTITILLILGAGSIMSIGFEKIFLMQNPMNTSVSEVIPTYVYKVGLLSANYSYSTAVGLFNSLVNMILILSVNYAARKISNNSLF